MDRLSDMYDAKRSEYFRKVRTEIPPLLPFHPPGEPSQTLRFAKHVMILITESGCVVITSQTHLGNAS